MLKWRHAEQELSMGTNAVPHIVLYFPK